jgi:CRISPR system Cascade subunit CasA
MNLLLDPIFTLRDLQGSLTQASLPALYTALAADAVDDLPALRPHQRQPLHSFLVQAGALALHRAGRDDPPQDATEWLALLRGLTPNFQGDEPWTLVVDDLSKPALLQPPVPEGTLDALKETEPTPDALDMLVTSKNHDVKARRLAQATPEHWLAALLTLQTMEGFLGAGNYGISRMNGGFASRPMVSLAPKGGIGARVMRDIRALMALRDEPGNASYDKTNGRALLWLEPWDGTASLSPNKLDPWYIEICRRIRLTRQDGGLIARRASSKAARIAMPKELNGQTGDGWTPVNLSDLKKGKKALTVDGSGFDYKRVTDLLDKSAFEPAPLQLWRQDDGREGLSLNMTALARGQGGTDGFHERRVPLPPSAARLLGKVDDPYARLARRRVEDAGTTRRAVLRTALFVLFQNAPDDLNLRHAPSDTKAEPFLAAFDRRVDRVFFEMIRAEFDAAPDDKDAARRVWLDTLQGLARVTLEEAATSVPLSGLRRYSTIAAARATLNATFHKRFLEQAADVS